jgi:Tol biopolymer transport system component
MTRWYHRPPMAAALLLLIFACAESGPADPVGQGALRVTIVTTGAELDDEYQLAIWQGDASGGGGVIVPIGPNASYVDTQLGAYTVYVALRDVASNCTVTGANQRTLSISVGDTASTTFLVSCVAATAQVVVRTSTTGVDRDVDGYFVLLDGAGRLYGLGIDDSLALSKVPPGTHRLALRGAAANCAIGSDSVQTAAFVAGDTLRIDWTIACTLATDRRLVFIEGDEIYVRNPGAPIAVNVTNNVARDWLPVWSPDGAAIAFVSDRSGNDDIYVMRSDGSDVTNLTNNAHVDSYPNWSPDGTRIVFVSDRDGGQRIYVMNADGTGQTQLTINAGADLFPSFSPDGTQIAFVRGCLACDAADVYIMHADGSTVTRLTTSAQVQSGPVWSPDGGRIAFSGRVHAFVIDPDGSQLVQLAAGSNRESPTWSPDGSRFAFASYGAIYLANRDGSGMTLLTRGEFWSGAMEAGDPAWSQDGTKIAFLVLSGFGWFDGSNDLTVINPDGTGQIRLTNFHYLGPPAWAPK